jgi:hypothetical protein
MDPNQDREAQAATELANEIRSLNMANRAALREVDRLHDEIARLLAVLKQCLRQWKMYSEMAEGNQDFDLAKEKSLEADIYRAAYALAHAGPEQGVPDWEDLRGCAPDATGNLSSEDFVRGLRDDWPDHQAAGPEKGVAKGDGK